MEGRFPPPNAKHPFPDNPDLTKIWGTPLQKALLKSFGVFMLGYSCFLGINLYLTRHQKGPFGMDLTATKEQLEKSKKIREEASKLRLINLPVQHRSRDVEALLKPELLFNDEVEYNPTIPRSP